jgi:membrane-associated phospholipid phosphatase
MAAIAPQSRHDDPNQISAPAPAPALVAAVGGVSVDGAAADARTGPASGVGASVPGGWWATDGRRQVLSLAGGAVALGALMTAVGLVLTHLLTHTWLVRTDQRISSTLAAHRTAGLTSLTWWTTQMGESFTIIALTVVGVIVLRLRSKRWLPSLHLMSVVAGEFSIFVVITLFVHRHRPAVHHLDAAPATSSFPSGHVGASVAFYGAIAVLAWALGRSAVARWTLTVIAVAVPIVVACSRLYRGMHFTTDVLSGALLGAAWLWWVTTVLRPGAARPPIAERP